MVVGIVISFITVTNDDNHDDDILIWTIDDGYNLVDSVVPLFAGTRDDDDDGDGSDANNNA